MLCNRFDDERNEFNNSNVTAYLYLAVAVEFFIF